MKLDSVSIKGFRSIEASTLQACGQFNVLIGKNNSGKSNALSAIHAFFSSIQGGSVVTLQPLIGQELDFFNRNTASAIEITATFSLTLAERDALLRDIVSEAPQVKNAVDGIDPALCLSVTLTMARLPSRMGYISNISLGSARSSGKRNGTQRVILAMSNEAATELHGQLSQRRRLASDLKAIESLIGNEDLRVYFPESTAEGRPRPPLSYLLSRPTTPKMSDQLRESLKVMLSDITTYDSFIRNLRQLEASIQQDDAAASLDQQLKNKIGTFAGDESSVPQYVRNLLWALSEIKVLRIAEQRKPIGKEEADRLLSLKVQRGGPQVLRNIQETVSGLLGVQIDAFQSTPPSRSSGTTAEMDVDNFLVEVNGSGIREALRLVLDVEFEHPEILLVEEPEIYLHPGLEISMMRYLKRISSDCQVFITTHSTNFLDTPEMKNVYLVSKTDSTRIRPVDFEEAGTQLPGELGIRLSSLFMFDRLVFVESPGDEAIIREWASTLGVNLSQANVGFIAMGGARNLSYFAAEGTLSFLTKRQIKMWFLIDHDERDGAEIERLRTLLGDNAVIEVLKRREIENYLLCPSAIAEFIRRKGQASSFDTQIEPTEADIAMDIEQCASELKLTTIGKRVAWVLCKPTYPRSKRLFEEQREVNVVEVVSKEIQDMIGRLQETLSRVKDVATEQSAFVDKVWQKDKVAVVPGDILLDRICQKHGVRFKKDQGDGARIAALMAQADISNEMTQIIGAFGATTSAELGTIGSRTL